jgi:hypothetical protein
LTFKKFDLDAYGKDLLKKWKNLNDEQKKSPYLYDIAIPSCMQVIDKSPTITTPFPLCLSPNMANAALEKYTTTHPEIKVTEEEIKKAEAELISKKIPLLPC